MLKKTICYTDYNGVERKEDFFFNLTKAELFDMEMGTVGGFTGMVKKIIDAKETPRIIALFKKLILQAYGEKSEDGKQFLKEDLVTGAKLSKGFAQTEAYSQLYMELATNSDAAADFIKGVVPSDIAEQAALQENQLKLMDNTGNAATDN